MLRCSKCRHAMPLVGETHIKCANPDPNMETTVPKGKEHWFNYPTIFDPVWGIKCNNFTLRDDTMLVDTVKGDVVLEIIRDNVNPELKLIVHIDRNEFDAVVHSNFDHYNIRKERIAKRIIFNDFVRYYKEHAYEQLIQLGFQM